MDDDRMGPGKRLQYPQTRGFCVYAFLSVVAV